MDTRQHPTIEVVAGPGAVTLLLAESARSYAAASRAEATLRAYAGDWRRFEEWCSARVLGPLPAASGTVALYLSDLANQGRKAATIGRALVSISQAHKLAGQISPRTLPAVREVMQGIRRTLGTAPAQKSPALVSHVRSMLAALPDGPLGTRDRALLLLGFAGAFRRSELVALEVSDLAETADGLEITLRRSKTDQEARGRRVGIPYGSSPATCPVRAVRAWRAAAQIQTGPLLRAVDRHGRIGAGRLTAQSVALALKRAAQAAGLDPVGYSGHSLRAGLCTSSAKAGKSLQSIAEQTGHRNLNTVRRYVRQASLFTDNAAAGIGL